MSWTSLGNTCCKSGECIEGTSFSVSKSNFSRNISPSVVFTFFSLISTGLLIFGVYCRKYDIDCRGILYEGQSVLDGRIGSEKTGHPTDTVLIEIVEETLNFQRTSPILKEIL